MKKLLGILIYCFLCIWTVFSQEYTVNCLEPVVLLQNDSKDMSGSAVIVESRNIGENNYLNILLTCEHVFVTSLSATTMKYKDGFVENDKTYKIQPIYLSEEKDLAIAAFISDKELKKANIDIEIIPAIKDTVFCVGCGLGDPPRYSEGLITGLGKSKKDFSFIQTSIYIVPGDSGSPLYYKNKIIGITSSIKSFSHNGKTHAANGISLFKSIQLYKNALQSPRYDFVLDGKKNYPRVLADYLWIKDATLIAD